VELKLRRRKKVKIAIYRSRENGEILRIHEISKDLESAAESAVADYNGKDHADTVETKDLSDLELYLYNRSEMSIKNYKEEIENMWCTVHEIEKSLDWLCNEANKN